MSSSLCALQAPPKLCQQRRRLDRDYRCLVTSYYKTVLALCDTEKFQDGRIGFQERLDVCKQAKQDAIAAKLRLESHCVDHGC